MRLIEILQERVQSDDVLLIAGSTAPENFTGVIKDFKPDLLIITDAARIGLSPGEAAVIPLSEITGASFSTHMLPLSVMLNYLEAEISCETVFIGIQPRSTDQGMEICDEVCRCVQKLADEFTEAFALCQKTC